MAQALRHDIRDSTSVRMWEGGRQHRRRRPDGTPLIGGGPYVGAAPMFSIPVAEKRERRGLRSLLANACERSFIYISCA